MISYIIFFTLCTADRKKSEWKENIRSYYSNHTLLLFFLLPHSSLLHTHEFLCMWAWKRERERIRDFDLLRRFFILDFAINRGDALTIYNQTSTHSIRIFYFSYVYICEAFYIFCEGILLMQVENASLLMFFWIKKKLKKKYFLKWACLALTCFSGGGILHYFFWCSLFTALKFIGFSSSFLPMNIIIIINIIVVMWNIKHGEIDRAALWVP
jgi:hypothetical protein